MDEHKKILTKRECVEDAVKYLVIAILENNNSNRPLLLHSLRMGFNFHDKNYPEYLVIAGILHDITIETHITPEDIENNFDSNVAELVRVYSLYDDMTELIDYYDLNDKNDYKFVKDLLLLKCMDYYDIMKFCSDCESKNKISKKMHRFKNRFEEMIKNEKVYKLFLNQFKNINLNSRYGRKNI